MTGLDAGAADVVRHAMERIQRTVHSLGFQCPTPPAPVPPSRTRKNVLTMHKLRGPSPTEQKKARIDSTNEWHTMGRLHRIRMVQIIDMAHRYRLPLVVLLEELIRFYQPMDRRERLWAAARDARHTTKDDRKYPGLGFPLWNLAGPKSWTVAQRLAKQRNTILTPEQFDKWQQAERERRCVEAISRHAARSPLDGGKMDDYLSDVAERREKRRAAIERRIQPYRVAA